MDHEEPDDPNMSFRFLTDSCVMIEPKCGRCELLPPTMIIPIEHADGTLGLGFMFCQKCAEYVIAQYESGAISDTE